MGETANLFRRSRPRHASMSVTHDGHYSIFSTLPIHLDHDNFLEVLRVRGRSEEARNLAATLIGTKGVKHGRMTISASGASLK